MPASVSFEAAPVLGEQAYTKVFFQHLELPADRTMGHVQLLSGLANAVQARSRLKSAQGIQRWEVSAHL